MIGMVLDGKWQLQGRLGTGGMGSVFLARDVDLDRKVAIKILSTLYTESSDALQRFEREARLMAKLDHPNLVPIYAIGRFENRPFIVMKCIDGKSLYDFQWEHQGPMRSGQAVGLVSQLLSGLEHLHSHGIVHRDIKPSNMMVSEDGRLTLLDFGVARSHLGQSDVTVDGSIIGTPRYMAPEQIFAEKIDGRADIYAAGIVLYELLTFIPPFGTDNDTHMLRAHVQKTAVHPCQLNPAIPEALGDAVMKAMAKSAGDRFQTAREFRKVIEEATTVTGFSEAPTTIARAPEAARAVVPVGAQETKDAPPPSEETALSEEPTDAAHEALRAPRPAPKGQKVPRAALALTAFLALGGLAAWGLKGESEVPPVVALTAEIPLATVTQDVADASVDAVEVPDSGEESGQLNMDAGAAVIDAGSRNQTVKPPRGPGSVFIALDKSGPASWAYVNIDGVRVDKVAPSRFTLSPGRHSIELVREGLRSVKSTVVIQAGKQSTVTLSLKAP